MLMHGLDIRIETMKGRCRTGVGADRQTMGRPGAAVLLW